VKVRRWRRVVEMAAKWVRREWVEEGERWRRLMLGWI